MFDLLIDEAHLTQAVFAAKYFLMALQTLTLPSQYPSTVFCQYMYKMS